MDLGSSSEMPKYIKHNEGEREYRNKIAMKRRGRSSPQGIAKAKFRSQMTIYKKKPYF